MNNKHTMAVGVLAASVIVAITAYAAAGSNATVTAAKRSISGVASVSVRAHPLPAARKVLPSAAPAETSFDRFIVRYGNGLAKSDSQVQLMSAVNAAAMRAGVAGLKRTANGTSTALSMKHVRKLATGGDLIKLSRSLSQAEANALLAQLRIDPSIKYAQPDYIKRHADFIPNDPRLDLQWHYTHPTTGIKAPAAWDVATGAGVVVAVLDTGYLDHADLDANIVPGYDFITDTYASGDGDGRDADAHDPGDWEGSSTSSFHGTHVAGTVGAVTNNGLALAGVAFDAKVQPVRVLGRGGGYTSDIADAIIWASGGSVAGVPDNANPAEVINLSLGGYGACSDDPVTQAAVDSAISRGVTVVVAAGNANSDATFHSPASCKGVITVGATGVDGARSYFSNYGPSVSLSAPGGNAASGSDPNDRWIWSLGNSGTQEPVASPAGDVMVGMIGTSMSSPHVAGVVALMQAAAVSAGKSALTPVQVKNLLKSTAIPFTMAPPVNKPQGAGILNAAAAVQAATQDIPVDLGELLSSRVALPGQTGTAGDTLLYRIVVPAGRASLNLRTYGGSGDVSLYVSQGTPPTTTTHQRMSAKAGNTETVVITRPAAGIYYMLVVGETAFANVTVMGLY